MRDETIYVKVGQSTQVSRKRVTLQDICEIYAKDFDVIKKLNALVVWTFSGQKNEKQVFSTLYFTRAIQKEYPTRPVVLLGAPDTVVAYQKPGSRKLWWECMKLIILCLTTFFGAAFTIMTFNTDVSVGEVFDLFYALVMQKPKQGGSILEISYSIGIPVGILAFFNHFSALKTKEDPTPIHIEMRNYEEEMHKAIIADAAREGREQT